MGEKTDVTGTTYDAGSVFMELDTVVAQERDQIRDQRDELISVVGELRIKLNGSEDS